MTVFNIFLKKINTNICVRIYFKYICTHMCYKLK